MKRLCFLLFLFFALYVHAQNKCNVSIVGDTCVTSVLTARTSKTPDTLIWYKDTVPVVLRVNRGYNNLNTAVKIAGDKKQLPWSEDFCLDKKGNVYIADRYYGKVWKWKQGDDTGVVVANQIGSVSAIAVDSDGNLYVADHIVHTITKWEHGSRTKTIVAHTGCNDIFLDKKNNLYALDTYEAVVTKWPPGAIEGIIVAGGHGEGTSLKQLNNPNSIFVDDSENVFIADEYNRRVVKWPPGAKQGVLVAGGNGGQYAINQLSYEMNIFVDKDAHLFVSDRYNRVMEWPENSSYGITRASGYADDGRIIFWGRIVIDSLKNLYFLDEVVKKLSYSSIIDSSYQPPTNEHYYMGLYSVKAISKRGCIANSNPVFLNTVPEPVSSINGQSNAVCGDIILEYSGSSERSLSYEWLPPQNTTIISGQGTDHISLNISKEFSKGILGIISANACGSTYGFSKSLESTPSDPEINGISNVNAGQTAIGYTIAYPEISVYYNWVVPQGVEIVSGQGTAHIKVNWGNNPGNILVYASNDCGNAKHPGIKYVKIRDRIANETNFAEKGNINELFRNHVIYPQPAHNSATIQFDTKENAQYNLSITDMQGKLLLQYKRFSVAGKNKETINVSSLTAGAYLIMLSNEAGESKNLKLIKN